MADDLCGYDVFGIGDRAFVPIDQRPPPCREVARFIARDWGEESDLDLYLCPRHARAVAKLQDVKPERL
jgi:hypothetical protein